MLTCHRVPTLNQIELPVLLLWRIRVNSEFLSNRKLELFLSTNRILIFNSKLNKENQEENKTFQNINIMNIIKIKKDSNSLDSKNLTIEYYANHNIYKKLVIVLEFPKLSLLYKFGEYLRYLRTLKTPIPINTDLFHSQIKTHVQKMIDKSDVIELFPTTQALKTLLLERYIKGLFIPCSKIFENYTFYLVFLSKGLKDIVDSFFTYSTNNIMLKDLIKLTKFLFMSDLIFFHLYKQNKYNKKLIDKKIVCFTKQISNEDILKSLYFLKSSATIKVNYFGPVLYFFKVDSYIDVFTNYMSEKEFGIKHNFDNKFSYLYLDKLCKKGRCVRVVSKGITLYNSSTVLDKLEKEIDQLMK